MRRLSMKKIKDLQDYIQESGDSELKTANKMQQRYKKAIFFYLADAKKKYIANKKDALVLCTGHIIDILPIDKFI